MQVMSILTIIGALVGALMLAGTFAATGAPQEAAGAAMAVAFVVIPYCVTAMLQRKRLIELAEKDRSTID